MKRRSQTISTTPTPSPPSSSFHPSGIDKRTLLAVKTTKGAETSGPSGSLGTTGRCTLEEALECQVCLDVAVSPIYSCNDGGHILCYICHGKLPVPKKCPSCSSQGFHNNHALERLAQKLEYRMNCAHAEAGCKEKVLSTEFETHLNTHCYFRDIKCTVRGCNGISIKFNEFVTHRQRAHVLGLPLAAGVVRQYAIPIAPDPESYYEFVINFEKQPFILRTNLTDSMLYIWMAIMGDDKDAEQYFAKISLYGKHKLPGNAASYVWTLPVIPYHEDPVTEREKATPVFGTIGTKVFASMTDTIGIQYSFTMKIELIKVK